MGYRDNLLDFSGLRESLVPGPQQGGNQDQTDFIRTLLAIKTHNDALKQQDLENRQRDEAIQAQTQIGAGAQGAADGVARQKFIAEQYNTLVNQLYRAAEGYMVKGGANNFTEDHWVFPPIQLPNGEMFTPTDPSSFVQATIEADPTYASLRRQWQAFVGGTEPDPAVYPGPENTAANTSEYDTIKAALRASIDEDMGEYGGDVAKVKQRQLDAIAKFQQSGQITQSQGDDLATLAMEIVNRRSQQGLVQAKTQQAGQGITEAPNPETMAALGRVTGPESTGAFFKRFGAEVFQDVPPLAAKVQQFGQQAGDTLRSVMPSPQPNSYPQASLPQDSTVQGAGLSLGNFLRRNVTAPIQGFMQSGGVQGPSVPQQQPIQADMRPPIPGSMMTPEQIKQAEILRRLKMVSGVAPRMGPY